jgi:hypothetical protein
VSTSSYGGIQHAGENGYTLREDVDLGTGVADAQK